MIIVRLAGGMGNQMFQYALGRVLALKNSTSLKLDISLYKKKTYLVQREYVLDVFNIAGSPAHENEIPKIHKIYFQGVFLSKTEAFFRKMLKHGGKEKSFSFDSKILSLGPDVYLEGYWQSYKYFNEYRDIILQDFTLKNRLSDEILSLKKEIEQSDSLCVHVRRGDYVGNAQHETVGKSYYGHALEKMDSLAATEKIYVFSDDIAWCEKNMKFEFPTTFVGDEYAGEKAEGHFALMTACKNFIITNSTFSWWPAWLSQREEKIVIAPKKWFPDPSIDTRDLIPEEWIRL